MHPGYARKAAAEARASGDGARFYLGAFSGAHPGTSWDRGKLGPLRARARAEGSRRFGARALGIGRRFRGGRAPRLTRLRRPRSGTGLSGPVRLIYTFRQARVFPCVRTRTTILFSAQFCVMRGGSARARATLFRRAVWKFARACAARFSSFYFLHFCKSTPKLRFF